MWLKALPYIVGAAIVVGIWLHGENYGKKMTEASYVKARQERAIEEEKAKRKLDAERIRLAIQGKQIEEKLNNVQDPTGCSYQRAPDAVTSGLHAIP